MGFGHGGAVMAASCQARACARQDARAFRAGGFQRLAASGPEAPGATLRGAQSPQPTASPSPRPPASPNQGRSPRPNAPCSPSKPPAPSKHSPVRPPTPSYSPGNAPSSSPEPPSPSRNAPAPAHRAPYRSEHRPYRPNHAPHRPHHALYPPEKASSPAVRPFASSWRTNGRGWEAATDATRGADVNNAACSQPNGAWADTVSRSAPPNTASARPRMGRKPPHPDRVIATPARRGRDDHDAAMRAGRYRARTEWKGALATCQPRRTQCHVN